jgi:hypothetical protein
MNIDERINELIKQSNNPINQNINIFEENY